MENSFLENSKRCSTIIWLSYHHQLRTKFTSTLFNEALPGSIRHSPLACLTYVFPRSVRMFPLTPSVFREAVSSLLLSLLQKTFVDAKSETRLFLPKSVSDGFASLRWTTSKLFAGDLRLLLVVFPARAPPKLHLAALILILNSSLVLSPHQLCGSVESRS